MADIKTPFSDAIESGAVPKTGSGKESYEQAEYPGAPGRTGGELREVYRDNIAGSPSSSGPIKTVYKDKI
jgi:hypothetical protein